MTPPEVVHMTWTNVTDALANLWSLVGSCVDFFVQNPALMVMFVGGLAAVGFRVFKRAKRAAR